MPGSSLYGCQPGGQPEHGVHHSVRVTGRSSLGCAVFSALPRHVRHRGHRDNGTVRRSKSWRDGELVLGGLTQSADSRCIVVALKLPIFAMRRISR